MALGLPIRVCLAALLVLALSSVGTAGIAGAHASASGTNEANALMPAQTNVLERATQVLDRIVDFLNQLNHVLNELAQLFGESEGGAEG